MSYMYNQQPPQMQVSESELQGTFAAAMSRVYLWMFLGLLVTTASALFTVSFDPLLRFIFSTPIIPIGLTETQNAPPDLKRWGVFLWPMNSLEKLFTGA